MFLLDTDTVIYSLKGHPQVVANLDHHRTDPLAVSIITLMELFYGAHKSQQPTANLAKVHTVGDALEIIPLGPAEADIFGRHKAELERSGTLLDDFDLAIAACALTRNLTLVTNNTAHFTRIPGLRLETWTRESGGR
ncbi:MAG: type II toxin-antitoxin system VapC family toxin [Desulfohalobiaceae bacterium]